jgi:hypothetical protein
MAESVATNQIDSNAGFSNIGGGLNFREPRGFMPCRIA